ncbi:MAG: CBS domain-containing protein [Thermoproteota archaeon]|jgi:CBS domain-containing protein|nr:CBS domain-containing protein [Thermoproteota archaeon]
MISQGKYSQIKVADYSSKEVFVVTPNDTMNYARKIMLKNGISRVVVINEENKIVGIITLRDIASVLTKLASSGELDTNLILVKNIMTKNVIKVNPNTSVKEAALLMIKNKIGSVVVEEDGEIAGIFTKTDVCRVFNDYPIEEIKVKNVMQKKFITVNILTSLWKVIEKVKEGEDLIIVEDNKKPVGIITLSMLASLDERDFIKGKVDYLRGDVNQEKIKIGNLARDFMFKIDTVIYEEEKLQKAVNYILKFNIPALPVVNATGSIIGLISKTDVTKVVALL